MTMAPTTPTVRQDRSSTRRRWSRLTSDQETYDRNSNTAMLPPGVESWTDTSNNEAWLAGKIGYTLNAFSVYAASNATRSRSSRTGAAAGAAANNGDSRDSSNVGWLTIFKARRTSIARKLALYSSIPNSRPCPRSPAASSCRPTKLWTDEVIADPNFAIIKEQVSAQSVHQCPGPLSRARDRCHSRPGVISRPPRT